MCGDGFRAGPSCESVMVSDERMSLGGIANATITAVGVDTR